MPTSRRLSNWFPILAITGLLAAFFAVAAAAYLRSYTLSFACQAALYGSLLLLLILSVAPAAPVRRLPASFLIAGLLAAYFVYAAGCADLGWNALARMVALAGIPIGIYVIFPVQTPARLTWQDAVAWTWLAVAIVLRQTNGIWTVPVNLDFMSRLFVLAVASWCWVFLRPVPGIAYNFSVSRRTLKASGLNFLLFAAIALPASLLMHFASWRPRWPGAWNFFANLVEIFIFIAWIEELFFRGFLQTLLSNTLESPILARVLASFVFGFSHILQAPAPNWRYVALASVAGWFYGSAFVQGGNLMASSLTHAAVDAVWRTWFGRG